MPLCTAAQAAALGRVAKGLWACAGGRGWGRVQGHGRRRTGHAFWRRGASRACARCTRAGCWCWAPAMLCCQSLACKQQLAPRQRVCFQRGSRTRPQQPRMLAHVPQAAQSICLQLARCFPHSCWAVLQPWHPRPRKTRRSRRRRQAPSASPRQVPTDVCWHGRGHVWRPLAQGTTLPAQCPAHLPVHNSLCAHISKGGTCCDYQQGAPASLWLSEICATCATQCASRT